MHVNSECTINFYTFYCIHIPFLWLFLFFFFSYCTGHNIVYFPHEFAVHVFLLYSFLGGRRGTTSNISLAVRRSPHKKCKKFKFRRKKLKGTAHTMNLRERVHQIFQQIRHKFGNHINISSSYVHACVIVIK